MLTLVTGKKEWKIILPDSSVFLYCVNQKPGQTMFIPPGFRRRVKTISESSIAIGLMWTRKD
jgi:hypothetical protein